MLIDKRPRGDISPPPSKSISHRALICAALSGGGTVSNLAENRDVEMTLGCLALLGTDFKVKGGGISFSSGPKAPRTDTVFDCGESGSTLRFLIPLAAVFGRPVTFTGRGRLMERPLETFQKSFGPRGVTLLQKDGCVSLRGELTPGKFELEGDVSSQFVTGLLFALPLLAGDSELIITSPLQSRGYVDLTLSVLAAYGIQAENRDYRAFFIPGGQRYKPCGYRVEADYSAAAFLLTAAALGCEVRCTGLNPESLQGDRVFLDILQKCGAAVRWPGPDTVTVEAGALRSISVDVSDIPDLVPPLAVLLCFCHGTSEIKNAARLRIKESDRLMAVSAELRRLGARLTEGADYLKIEGSAQLRGGFCKSHNDHRIAMMVALASIKARGPVHIDDPDCVNKSYPDFWKDFLRT